MQYQQFGSPEELRDTINCFWHTKIDFGAEPSTFEILPDGYAEIVFYFKTSCNIAYEDGLQVLPSPFIMGLLNQPILLQAQNQLEVIGIKCYPWTVFDLLGLPAGQYGVRLFKHPIAQLQSTLNDLIQHGKISEAIDEVKVYFLNARLKVDKNSMLFKAGNAMRAANGKMPVREVAAAAHATVRTLERNFKQSSGFTVKDVSSLMRFEQVRNRLWFYPETNLAGLAHELGYADQAHLSKEFKRYSGITPAASPENPKVGKR